jgi:pimeloyl-ACP methyl ester carboxylesterase
VWRVSDRKRGSPELPIFVSEENRSRLMAIYDDALRRWPVPYETRFVATRYGSTHVIVSGDRAAPPVVMTHPMGVGGFMWSSIFGIVSAHRRAYALDTVGDVGRSELDSPEKYPKTGANYSQWLGDVFESLDLTTADMIGGSMGGWIAMNHAIYAPRRVRRLVLLGPMGLAPWRSTLAVLGPFLSQRVRPSERKLDAIITRSLGEGARVNREFRPWMKVMGYTKARLGQPFHIPSRLLRKIEAPTLIFLGGRDGLVGDPAAAAKRARRNITGSEIQVLPDAGHVMSVDEPQLVGERIVDFLV